MNQRFYKYVSMLAPAKQLLAREAVQEYLAGESEEIERILSPLDVWKKSRWLANKDT